MRPYHPPSTWLVVWPGRLPSWATAESESADWASIVVRAVRQPSTVNIRTREAMVSSLVTWEPRASRPEGRASRLDGHGYGRCHASTALSPELEQLDLHRGRSTPPHDALVLSSKPSAAAPSSPPANAPHARAPDSLCRHWQEYERRVVAPGYLHCSDGKHGGKHKKRVEHEFKAEVTERYRHRTVTKGRFELSDKSLHAPLGHLGECRGTQHYPSSSL